MRKTFQTTFLLYILLSVIFLAVYSPSVKAQTSDLVFQENFDGSTLDLSKWVILQNVNGGTGGSITVAGGSVYLSSYETSFPCITSRTNPVPTSGGFSLELNIQFASMAALGSGFWVSSTPYVVGNVGEAADILHVWADTTYGAVIFLLGRSVTISSSPPSYSPLKLENTNGTYFLYLNGALLTSAQSQLRPQQIGFGHPPAYYVPFNTAGVWTSFYINSINVYAETSSPTNSTFLPTLTGPSTTQPAELIITIAGIIIATIIIISLILLLYRSTKANLKRKKDNNQC
jgi:hypothetical protein